MLNTLNSSNLIIKKKHTESLYACPDQTAIPIALHAFIQDNKVLKKGINHVDSPNNNVKQELLFHNGTVYTIVMYLTITLAPNNLRCRCALKTNFFKEASPWPIYNLTW